jgi:hypothetical protein
MKRGFLLLLILSPNALQKPFANSCDRSIHADLKVAFDATRRHSSKRTSRNSENNGLKMANHYIPDGSGLDTHRCADVEFVTR